MTLAATTEQLQCLEDQYLILKPCKVKKNFPLHAVEAYRRCRSIAPLILNCGMTWTWMVNVTLLLLYLWERIPVPMK